MFSQATSIQEIIILPLENNVQVKRRTVVTNAGEVISTKDHYQLYAADDAEVVSVLQEHSVKAVADAAEALAAKATAEAALATAKTEHADALTAAKAAHTAELAAKDAEIARLTALIPTVEEKPQTVTMRQARLALLQAGLLDKATKAVAGAGPAAQIEWEYSSDVGRNAALVQALSGALGLTDEQLDGLFVVAATL